MDIYINKDAESLIGNMCLKVKTTLDYGYIYIDDIGNEYKFTRHWSEMLNKQLNVLQKLPVVGIEKLIHLVSTSRKTDKAVALCIEIKEREFDNVKAYRLSLLLVFEKMFLSNNDDFSFLEKIRICIYETSLYDSTNRDKIVGKKIDEISKDAKFYREISNRAKQLLEKIEGKLLLG